MTDITVNVFVNLGNNPEQFDAIIAELIALANSKKPISADLKSAFEILKAKVNDIDELIPDK